MKKVFSIVLIALMGLMANGASATEASQGNNEIILHAWSWSFNTIKQHLPEIEKIINDTVAFGDYKDKNLSLDSIYYAKMTRNEGRGTYDVVDFIVFYADGEGHYYSATYKYPFLDGTQVKASWCISILQKDGDPASIGDNNPDLTWVKLK